MKRSKDYDRGWWRGFASAWGAALAGLLLAHLTSCAAPQYIPDPVSMELWTDAPGEPDPLEACHRVTGPGACVVMSARAAAWWVAKWQGCEERLDNCEERK